MQKDGSQVETTRVRNILVLTTSYPNDSDDWSGVFIHKLNMALSRKGYRIFVLSPSNGGFYGLKRFDDITMKRFPYFWPRRLESLCSGAGGIPENMNKSILARFQVVTMTLLFGLHAFVQSRHADLIYANWLGSGIVGAIAGFIRGVPLVTSFRGDDGYLARKESVWRVFSKFVIARSSALALVSRELAEICLELGASKDRVFVPRFGVDTNLFCPDTHKNSDPQKVKIVYVGSLIPKKGVQDLIEALSAKVFDNVVLEVVGEGFYSDDLKKMAETANISHRVIWRGLATPNEVARIMKSADMLCLPSHTEGSPNVVKEAMSCGLPVVATRVGGIPDLIEDNFTGYLYNVQDTNDLAGKIRILVENSSLRRSFGHNARKKIMDNEMSWDDTASEFQEIFRFAERPK